MTLALKYTKQNQRYVFGGGNDIGLCNLGNFLTADLGNQQWDSFTSWALDDVQTIASANIAHLIKSCGHIMIGNLYAKDNDAYFSIPRDKFLRLLEQWQLIQSLSITELFIVFKEQELNIFLIDTNGDEYKVAI